MIFDWMIVFEKQIITNEYNCNKNINNINMKMYKAF